MAAFARGRYSKGDRGTPPPPATRHFPPDNRTISTFAIISSVTRRRTIERTASPTKSSIKSAAALVAAVSRRGRLQRRSGGRAEGERWLVISERAATEHSPQRIAYWLIIDIATHTRPRGRPHWIISARRLARERRQARMSVALRRGSPHWAASCGWVCDRDRG